MKFNIVFFDRPRFFFRLLGYRSLINVYYNCNVWFRYPNIDFLLLGKITKDYTLPSSIFRRKMIISCITLDDDNEI
jgi:hypothetical protein